MNFAIFEEVLNNFCRSDDEIISWKIMISTKCICGFMPSLHKKYWLVFNKYL